MSPEQARGGTSTGAATSSRSGCVLYEMVAGQKAFRGESITALLFKIITEEPPSLRELDPTVTDEMLRIIEQGALESARRCATRAAGSWPTTCSRCTRPGFVPTLRAADTPTLPPDAPPGDVPTIAFAARRSSPRPRSPRPRRRLARLRRRPRSRPAGPATAAPDHPDPADRAPGAADRRRQARASGRGPQPLVVPAPARKGEAPASSSAWRSPPCSRIAVDRGRRAGTCSAGRAAATRTVSPASRTRLTETHAKPRRSPRRGRRRRRRRARDGGDAAPPAPVRRLSGVAPGSRASRAAAAHADDAHGARRLAPGRRHSGQSPRCDRRRGLRVSRRPAVRGARRARRRRGPRAEVPLGGSAGYPATRFRQRPRAAPGRDDCRSAPPWPPSSTSTRPRRPTTGRAGRYGNLRELADANLFVLDVPFNAEGFRRARYGFRVAAEADGYRAEAVPQGPDRARVRRGRQRLRPPARRLDRGRSQYSGGTGLREVMGDRVEDLLRVPQVGRGEVRARAPAPSRPSG